MNTLEVLLDLHPLLRRASPLNELHRHRHGDQDDSDDSCKKPREHKDGEELSIGITVQQLFFYIALICLALTAINCFILMWGHLRRYTVPKEQKHCVRIIALPFVFCALAVIGIPLDEKSEYIVPWGDVYEALCVAGLFMLCVEFVAPDEATREDFFHSQPLKGRKGKVKSDSSLHWYRVCVPIHPR
jgi:hypothetical protein